MTVLFILLTGQFMANLDTSVVNVAAPAIHDNLRAGASALQLIVSGFVLTGIQRAYHGPGRARAIGYYALTLSAGSVAGQVLGGVLVWANLFGSSWRPIFLVNVPIGVALTAIAARTLPRDGGDRSRRLDLPGAAALALSVALAVVPLVLGRALHWPLWTVAALAACPVLLAVFGWFGLGIGTTALVTHLTGSVPPAHAAELSGLIPTTAQLSSVLGVATFGTLYIGLSRVAGFAVVTLVFGAAALLGAAAVYRSTRT